MGRRSNRNDGLTIIQGPRFPLSHPDDAEAPRDTSDLQEIMHEQDELRAKGFNTSASRSKKQRKKDAKLQTAQPKAKFSLKDKVNHPTFGLGLVVGLQATNIEVHFLDFGPKTIRADFLDLA
ncbi:hypothetical protein [Novosphingobium jiangmenense]|uniref:Uncharacterized protein n=1 Tax=Novosphingobium jiangmenense TaxID=2791981 RepID=A0ABS0HKG7_9SPHN|nr:hypothetical protein [Novosphingobium jiangmenense]MBF9152746.1 hypothetical protein [Novosphingobium jiangmenense]